MNTKKIAMLLSMGFAARHLDELDLDRDADAIRDMMDPLWFSLTEEERAFIRSTKRFDAESLLSWASKTNANDRAQELSSVLGDIQQGSYLLARSIRLPAAESRTVSNDDTQGLAA